MRRRDVPGAEVFIWHVPEALEWEEDGPWVLVPVGTPARPYRPLQEFPDLFLRFAEVKPDREGILAFARSYGLLSPQLGRVGPRVGIVDEARRWVVEIAAMRRVLDVWDLVGREDVAGLRRWIAWPREDRVACASEPGTFWGRLMPMTGGTIIASRRIRPHLLARLEPGDVIGPARYYVQIETNRRLQRRISPRLLWGAGDRLGLHWVPQDLAGALWLQFARAVESATEFRRCATCNRWIPITPEIARTNREYCSTACRMRAYRSRQETARRLHAQGMAPDRIAETVGSDVETVIGWIGGNQDGKNYE